MNMIWLPFSSNLACIFVCSIRRQKQLQLKPTFPLPRSSRYDLVPVLMRWLMDEKSNESEKFSAQWRREPVIYCFSKDSVTGQCKTHCKYGPRSSKLVSWTNTEPALEDNHKEDTTDAIVPGFMHFICHFKQNEFHICLQKLDSFNANFCIPLCVSS